MKTKTSFKKGESGNPKGRPRKDESLSDILRVQLNKRIAGGESKKLAKEAIVEAMIRLAVNGDLTAARMIMDRTEGTPKQTADINTQIEYTIIPPPPPEPIGD